MVKNNIEVDVKVKLLEAGKTQQQLGEEIGTTGQYINPHQQEKRRRTPTERPTAYTSPNHTDTARTEAPTPNPGGYSRLHFTATRTK